MKNLQVSYALSTFAAVALLGGCGGSQPPIGASGAMQATAAAAHAVRATSWMLPEAKRDDLLYVSDASSKVYVYSYPDRKLVGTLTGLDVPAGECVDPAGDVWVTEYGSGSSGEIVEYAHGGSQPIAMLSDDGHPFGCAIDAVTGNLAVANYYPATIEIYPSAQGTPTTYSSADFPTYYYCTYDAKGNLFADSDDSPGVLAELPEGGYSLQTISLNENLESLSMQWDGYYVAIIGSAYSRRGALRPDSRESPVGSGYGPLFHDKHGPVQVYRVNVAGSSGTIVGKVLLGTKHTELAVQYWIAGNTIIGPDSYKHDRNLAILSWKYPGGGQPIHAIRAHWEEPWGTALSLKPR